MGAFAGPSLTRGRKLDGAWSTSFGAHAQLSTPMQLIDAQAAYLRNDATGTLRSGQDLSIAQDTFSFGFGLHPFFLSYLRSSFWWNLLGSNYLYVGADIDRLSATVEGKEISELDLGLQVGWGLDIPLDDFNDGGAFWLGVQYRYNQYEFETQPIRALDVRQHLFFVRLSYRRNGLLRAF